MYGVIGTRDYAVHFPDTVYQDKLVAADIPWVKAGSEKTVCAFDDNMEDLPSFGLQEFGLEVTTESSLVCLYNMQGSMMFGEGIIDKCVTML